jgi:hypothetical protein
VASNETIKTQMQPFIIKKMKGHLYIFLEDLHRCHAMKSENEGPIAQAKNISILEKCSNFGSSIKKYKKFNRAANRAYQITNTGWLTEVFNA